MFLPPANILSIFFPVNLLERTFNFFCTNFALQFYFFIEKRSPGPILPLKMLFNITKLLIAKFRIS